MSLSHATVGRPRPSRSRWTTLPVVAQTMVLGGLWWVWATGESDSSATRVDWNFVMLAAVTPVLLAGSLALGLLGSTARRHYGIKQPIGIRAFVFVVQAITASCCALSLLLAPFVILGAIVFGPMG